MAEEAPSFTPFVGEKTKEMPVEGRLPAAATRKGGVNGGKYLVAGFTVANRIPL